MFEKIKSWFKPKSVEIPNASESESLMKSDKVQKPKKSRKPRKSKQEKELSEKEKATLANQPYIKILEMDIDSENINAGSITFDWNDKFVLNLVRAGYKIRDDDTDNDIVDRWFQTVCRNIALEVYEQKEADLTVRPKSATSDVRHVQRKDIGNNRSEIS